MSDPSDPEVYCCDLCSRYHTTIDGLRTIQVRWIGDEGESSIFTYVACEVICADKVRDQRDQIILTDEPFRGEYDERWGFM